MKSIRTVPLLVVLLTLSGCFGKKARDVVLAPALVQASKEVKADALSGLAVASEENLLPLSEDIEFFFTTIESKDRALILSSAWPLWPTVKGSAEAGIAHRVSTNVIGQGVGASKHEQLRQFERGLTVAVEKTD